MKGLKEYGLHHVGFIVKNLEEAIQYFEEIYGLKADTPYVFEPGKAWSYGREIEKYALKISMIRMDNGSLIELIQPVEGQGVHQEFIDAGNSGMHHICFSVDDYDHWRDYFANNHAEIIFESETEDELNGYRRCFYAKDRTVEMVYEIKENPYFRQ